jgi:ribosomal protein S27AE
MKIELINRHIVKQKQIKICRKCGAVMPEKSFYFVIGDNYDNAGDFCPSCTAVMLANCLERRLPGHVYFWDVLAEYK